MLQRQSATACDGCGQPGADERLWLAAPLGLCAIRVHRSRECAEAARVVRGGGRFVTFDEQPGRLPVAMAEDRQLLAAAQGYAKTSPTTPNHRRSTHVRIKWQGAGP